MPHLPRNSWRSSQLPSSFLLCKLDLCSQHLLAHYILYTTPYKIAGEWHSVTQGDTPVLLTCFPYHNILWLFCCHLRPSRWMVWVSLLQQVGDREKVRQDCSHRSDAISRPFYLVLVRCCVFLAFVLCPIQVPPETVNGDFLNWRGKLKV